MKFEQLPDDIIILILSFGKEIKYRRGKLIKQILENDSRREVLKRIARPFMLPNFLYEYVNNDIHYVNQKRKNRTFLTLHGRGMKEMIYYSYDENDVFYYGYVYVCKGRHMGYSRKMLYSIDLITDANGFQYNDYCLLQEVI